MGWKYGKESTEHLDSCHRLLKKLFREIIKHRDVKIRQGYRPEGLQNRAFADKVSRTPWPLSKHNQYPSEAVDAWPHPLPNWAWGDSRRARDFWVGWGNYVKGVADVMGIPITWGGDWNNDWESRESFFDGPHFQLRMEAL